MIEALLKSPLLFAIGVGIVVTALLGQLCGRFLDTSVTIDFPHEFKDFKEAETGGGGPQLGILERLLFFASLWLEAYVIAGGWLTFKVAAKWATWQHVTKIPETLKDEHDRNYFDARRKLSSRLLGRFLNGTLYNIFCAGVGALCGKALLVSDIYILHWVVGAFIFVVILIVIGWPLIGAPLKAKLKKHL